VDLVCASRHVTDFYFFFSSSLLYIVVVDLSNLDRDCIFCARVLPYDTLPNYCCCIACAGKKNTDGINALGQNLSAVPLLQKARVIQNVNVDRSDYHKFRIPNDEPNKRRSAFFLS
jgi:hypothetical protein